MGTTLERIAEIVKTGGEVPEGCSPHAFAKEILPLLGTTDGKLREWRVWGILALWVGRRVMSDDEIRDLLWTVADERHLFHGIGESGTDSVFMRSFAVLLLGAFAEAHRERAFLAAEEVRRLLETVVRYLGKEVDLRGFVSKEKLWAHACAHAADTIGQLAPCRELAADDLASALEGLGRKATTDRVAFVFEEDARLAAAAVEILKLGIVSGARVAAWAASLVPPVHFSDDLPFVLHRYVNARNFLRGLVHHGEAAGVAAATLEPVRAARVAVESL